MPPKGLSTPTDGFSNFLRPVRAANEDRKNRKRVFRSPTFVTVAGADLLAEMSGGEELEIAIALLNRASNERMASPPTWSLRGAASVDFGDVQRQ